MGRARDRMMIDPGDFWGDENVRVMSVEEVYAYWRLLCYQWEYGDIPNDIVKIAAILSEGPRIFRPEDVAGEPNLKGCLSQSKAGLWLALSHCFVSASKAGRLVNPRLYKERSEWERKRRTYAENGKMGGRPRKDKPKKAKMDTGREKPSQKQNLSQKNQQETNGLELACSLSSSSSLSLSREEEDIPPSPLAEDRGASAAGSETEDRPKGARRKLNYTTEFERVYKVWRRSGGKGDAFKAWKQMEGDRPSAEEVISKIHEMQDNHEPWRNVQYQPLLATWLRRGGWDDAPLRNGKQGGSSNRRVHAEIASQDRVYYDLPNAPEDLP